MLDACPKDSFGDALMLERKDDYKGEMAEWSNVPDSKSGVRLAYRGFESLSLRLRSPKL